MTKQFIFPTILCCLISSISFAQQVRAPFNTETWNLENAETKIEQYMGRSSILLKNGSIVVKDVQFLNGTIEVDINFPADRNFPGLSFRGQDPQNYESFYIRPHQSGNPDACQYTPDLNGFAGWQLYYGEGYGKAVELQPDQWHHLKMVVKGELADVYFDDMEQPLLHINRLKGDFPAGFIGLNSGSGVHFANYSYQLDETDYLITAEGKPDDKTVAEWELSELLDNQFFADKTQVDRSLAGQLHWTSHPTESTGLLNIARYTKAEKDKTTVVARLRINTEQDQIKGLRFGYSDEVMVFVNGKLQYMGNTVFRSRDYRYLGTIGYFDAVFLDLKKGENEVWFVVKENFGGWGLQARYF
ncbi:MAG: hypothetical protein R2824_23420 [Saprospiraceae bacterium]